MFFASGKMVPDFFIAFQVNSCQSLKLWKFSILSVSTFMVYISHCLLNLVHCGTHKSFIVDLKEMIFWIATKQGRLFEGGKTKRICETILWREIKHYRQQSHCSKDNSGKKWKVGDLVHEPFSGKIWKHSRNSKGSRKLGRKCREIQKHFENRS